jgi:hypothetical protein
LMMIIMIMILMQWSHPPIYPFIHHLCSDSRWSSGVRGAFKDGGEASPQDPQSARWVRVNEWVNEWLNGWMNKRGREEEEIYGAKADDDDPAML